jgi:hypothetical protein
MTITKPREQWKFIGREKHYGYEYLIWELVSNPSRRYVLGNRFVRQIA